MSFARAIRAFAWLRWRTLVNSLRGGERRDTLERASRVLALVVPGLLAAMATTAVVVSTVLGWIGGWGTVTHFLQFASVLPVLRVLLMLALVVAVLLPLFVGTHGGTASFTRLLLLPLPRGTLHFVEVVTTLAEPWLAYVVPGLIAYAAGILAAALWGGEIWHRLFITDGLMALAAGVAMAVVLASLSAMVSFVVSWLVRDRRRSELFVLIFVLSLSLVSIIPALVSSRLDRESETDRAARGRLALPSELPAWTIVLPSELYYRAVQHARDWPRPSASVPLAALWLEGALLYLLSAGVYKLRIGSAEGRRSRGLRAASGRGGIRLPGYWPGTSAVAFTQARTALRSVRGRLVVMLPGPLVAMMSLLFANLRHAGRIETIVAFHGYITLYVGIVFALYAAQAITMNQFGSDRAGLTLQFLVPVRDVDVVRGKATGCGILIGLGAVVCLGCMLAVSPSGSPWQWAAAMLGALAAFLLLIPAAAWFSAVLPVASDLSKTGSGGNPHSLSLLAGTLVVAVAAAPGGLMLTLLGPMTAFIATAILTVAAWMFAYVALGWVARTVRMRRENLVLVAQGR